MVLMMLGQDYCKFRSGMHGLNEELGRHRGRQEGVFVV